jgi:hypothetical protein
MEDESKDDNQSAAIEHIQQKFFTELAEVKQSIAELNRRVDIMTNEVRSISAEQLSVIHRLTLGKHDPES